MKTKRVKAIKAEGYSIVLSGIHCFSPYYILPADSESYVQLVEQAAIAIAEYRNWKGCFYTDCPHAVRDTYRDDARAALRAIGITQPRKVKGTK